MGRQVNATDFSASAHAQPARAHPRSHRASHIAIPIALALGALVIHQTGLVRASKSATFDEVSFLEYGLRVYRAGDFTGLMLERPLPSLLADWAAALSEPPDFPADPRRLPAQITATRLAYSAMVGVPVVLLVLGWLTCRSGVLAGAIGGGLMAFSPTILAHSSLATTDACFAVFFLLALAAMVWYQRRPTPVRLLLLGASLGMAQASKQSAVVLFGLVLMPMLEAEQQIGRSKRPLSRIVNRLAWKWLAVLAIAFLTTWSLYGFTVTPSARFADPLRGGRIPLEDPGLPGGIPAPIAAFVGQIRHAQKGHQSYLLGVRSLHGSPWYFPVAFAVKSTPAEWLVALIAWGIMMFKATWRDPTRKLWILALLLYAAATIASPLNLGHRHLLPVYPLLVLLSIDGLAARPSSRPPFLAVIGTFLVGWQILSAYAIAPDYLSYFNSISGGPTKGDRYLVDSNLDWGQDLPTLRKTLKRLGGSSVMLAYFGKANPAAYGIRTSTWTDPEKALAEGCRHVAISVTLLHGLYLQDDPFKAFRMLEPESHAGYSIRVYDLKQPAVREALNQARRRLP